MLILSRKSGESLMIGDDIVVTVLDANLRQVRIGISAPQEISVHREEIYLRVAAERHQNMDSSSQTSGHFQTNPVDTLDSVGSKQ